MINWRKNMIKWLNKWRINKQSKHLRNCDAKQYNQVKTAVEPQTNLKSIPKKDFDFNPKNRMPESEEQIIKGDSDFNLEHLQHQAASRSDFDFNNRTRESEVREKESLAQKIEDDRVSKKSWSHFIMGYLSAFTFFLFFTIWSGHCIKLSPVTLNILISVGFTKVVAIAYIVVKHFYPLDEIKKIKNN